MTKENREASDTLPTVGDMRKEFRAEWAWFNRMELNPFEGYNGDPTLGTGPESTDTGNP
ncbi:hypothetical protein HYU96_01180 [Candidatus Daviesbacteria bacterium]|nr:hypothetical protein [Candidatus Daviesbacteria bacterium]